MSNEDKIISFLTTHPGSRFGEVWGAVRPIQCRALDRLLQGLRRQGVISYRNKRDGGPGWFVEDGR